MSASIGSRPLRSRGNRGRHHRPIAELIGLGAAVDYLNELGREASEPTSGSSTAARAAHAHERHGDHITIQGPPRSDRRGALIRFVSGIHPHDKPSADPPNGDLRGASHQCAKPMDARLGVGGHMSSVGLPVQRCGRCSTTSPTHSPHGRVSSSGSSSKRPGRT